MGPFPFGLPSGARELDPPNQRRIVRISPRRRSAEKGFQDKEASQALRGTRETLSRPH